MTSEYLKTRTPEQLETIIARHRDAGKMDAPMCVEAMAELSTRTVKGFNLKLGIEHLIAAAKTETPLTSNRLQLPPVFSIRKPRSGAIGRPAR